MPGPNGKAKQANGSRGGDSIHLLKKAAAVLDSLAAQTEMTPAEIAQEIDEPRSSVYRLLASLRDLGFVDAGNSRGTVRLGVKLLRLGALVAAAYDERNAALPVMAGLAEETGETVFLCVRRDFDAVCIERIEGERVQSLALRLGGSMPLHVGGAPPVLLAYEPREVWDEYIESRDLTGMTEKSVTSKKALVELLTDVRERGYAVSDEDITPGIAAVGAPVFDHQGRICAALSISGTRPLILGDEAETVRKVSEAARDISRAMGYDVDGPAGFPPAVDDSASTSRR